MGELLCPAIKEQAYSVMSRCNCIQNVDDFKCFIRGELRALIPHTFAVCGVADQGQHKELRHIGIDFPEDLLVQITENDISLFHIPFFTRWIKHLCPLVVNNFEDMTSTHSKCNDIFKKHDIKNAIVHGVLSIEGEVSSYFLFVRNPRKWTEEHRNLMELLTPHMHVALLRIQPRNFMNNHVDIDLTKREIEVLNWVNAGKTNYQIADMMYISTSTVQNHVHNIIEKLGVSNRMAASAKACRLGIIGASI